MYDYKQTETTSMLKMTEIIITDKDNKKEYKYYIVRYQILNY